MAGTDVVDRDAAAELLQSGDYIPGHGEILKRFALRDFERDLREADGRVREDLPDFLHDGIVLEVVGGQVEPDFNALPWAKHRRKLIARGAHDRSRHVDNQARRFRQRNKDGWRHDGAVALAPA